MMLIMKNYLNSILNFAYDNPGWFCFWFFIGWIIGKGIQG